MPLQLHGLGGYACPSLLTSCFLWRPIQVRNGCLLLKLLQVFSICLQFEEFLVVRGQLIFRMIIYLCNYYPTLYIIWILMYLKWVGWPIGDSSIDLGSFYDNYALNHLSYGWLWVILMKSQLKLRKSVVQLGQEVLLILLERLLQFQNWLIWVFLGTITCDTMGERMMVLWRKGWTRRQVLLALRFSFQQPLSTPDAY